MQHKWERKQCESTTVVPVMNGHPRDQAKVSVHCRWPLIRGNLTLKCVGWGIDNVAVQGRCPLTTGVAQGRYYCIRRWELLKRKSYPSLYHIYQTSPEDWKAEGKQMSTVCPRQHICGNGLDLWKTDSVICRAYSKEGVQVYYPGSMCHILRQLDAILYIIVHALY